MNRFKPRKPRSLQMDCLEQRALLATTATGAGAAYITNVYEQLLNRTPSQADVSYWSGVETRYGNSAVYNALLSSAEHQQAGTISSGTLGGSSLTTGSSFTSPIVFGSYLGGTQNVTAYVDMLYTTLLNRSADPAGAALYTGLIEKGTSLNTVANDILNSSEYQNLQAALGSSTGTTTTGTGTSLGVAQFGSLTNSQNATAFVDSLYTGILNRSADTAGANLFANQLQQGATANQLITEFLTSGESLQRITSGQTSLSGLATSGTGLGNVTSGVGTSTTGFGINTNTGLGIGTAAGFGLAGAGSTNGTGLGNTLLSGLGRTTGTGLGTTLRTGLGTTLGTGLGSTVGTGLGTTLGSGLGTSTSTGFGLAGSGNSTTTTLGTGLGTTLGTGLGTTVGTGLGTSTSTGFGLAGTGTRTGTGLA